jgi:hypothetical protein
MNDIRPQHYVYYYNESKQFKNDNGQLVAPISIVVKNVAGHFPTGSGGSGSEPYYWTQEITEERNARLGYSLIEAMKIVISSMQA